jgi:hypothetical protein
METNNYTSTTGIGSFSISSGTTTCNPYNNFISTTPNLNSFNLTPQNIIMQNKVAIFKVTRDEKEQIIKTEFIKELWVETKNGQSVDFQVARDKDLSEYEMSDLSIRTIYTVTF